MKKNRKTGVSLTQYIIVIGIVVIGIVLAYSLMGNIINANLSSYNNKLTDINKAIKLNSGSNIKPGSLGGTPAKPVSNCVGDMCTLDYGTFVLNGVPSNYDDYIQASGTSGGTDMFSNLFLQIANQLKANGDDAGFEEFKKLSQLAHSMANIQKSYEKTLGSFSPTDAKSPKGAFELRADCIKGTTPPALTDSVSDILTNYKTPNFNLVNAFSDMMGVTLSDSKDPNTKIASNLAYNVANRLDLAGNMKEQAFYNDATKTFPAYAFVNTYDKIMSNPKYPKELLDVTQKLYLNMSDLSYSQSVYIDACSYYGSTDMTKQPVIDSQGNSDRKCRSKGSCYNSARTNYDIVHPVLSKETNLNAALLCVSSKNYDNGNDCK